MLARLASPPALPAICQPFASHLPAICQPPLAEILTIDDVWYTRFARYFYRLSRPTNVPSRRRAKRKPQRGFFNA